MRDVYRMVLRLLSFISLVIGFKMLIELLFPSLWDIISPWIGSETKDIPNNVPISIVSESFVVTSYVPKQFTMEDYDKCAQNLDTNPDKDRCSQPISNTLSKREWFTKQRTASIQKVSVIESKDSYFGYWLDQDKNQFVVRMDVARLQISEYGKTVHVDDSRYIGTETLSIETLTEFMGTNDTMPTQDGAYNLVIDIDPTNPTEASYRIIDHDEQAYIHMHSEFHQTKTFTINKN